MDEPFGLEDQLAGTKKSSTRSNPPANQRGGGQAEVHAPIILGPVQAAVQRGKVQRVLPPLLAIQ